MTDEQKLQLIKQIIEHRKNINEFGDKFKLLFGSYPGNGECGYEAFERLFGDYTRLVDDKLGDAQHGIDWFIWENNCGQKAMEAGFPGDEEMMIIDSAEAYLDFLNKSALKK